MNELEIINKEFGNLKMVSENGKQFIEASAVTKILGYKNSSKAIGDHCRKDGIITRTISTAGGNQDVNLISEGNVYRLIAKSKLPAAEPFEIWIFDKVLPCIRKFGCYPAPTFNYNLEEYQLVEKDGNLWATNWTVMWLFSKTYRQVEKDLLGLSRYKSEHSAVVLRLGYDIKRMKTTYIFGKEAFDMVASKYSMDSGYKNRARREYLEIFDKYEMLSA